MRVQDLVAVFDREGHLLDATLRHHPRLRTLFTRDFGEVALPVLRDAYLHLLKLKADYVRFTVPALRAAGEVLAQGDEEDRKWSSVFLGYAVGETEEIGDYGHHIWALEDMKALDAPRELMEATALRSAELYGQYFITEAKCHPYAILGAKGVLESFSLAVSDDIVRGLIDSRLPNAENAVSFFRHHGVLDVEHVREGNRNLEKLAGAQKRFQILEGAYFTSGAYRSLVSEYLPS